MNSPDAEISDGLELLADEFLTAVQAGKNPRIDEFVAKLPEREEEVRRLLQAIVLLEGLSSQQHSENQLERLTSASTERIGDFRIVREIGRGGMGIVYEAIQESLGRRVALKVLNPQLAGSVTQVSRFRREAEAVAQLHHTNIVSVHSAGDSNGLQYIAMQYVDGVPLTSAIDSLRTSISCTAPGLTASLEPSKAEPQTASIQRPVAASRHDRNPSEAVFDATVILDSSDHDFDRTLAPESSGLPVSSKTFNSLPGTAATALVEPSVYYQSQGFELAGKHFKSHYSADYIRTIVRMGWQIADAISHAHQQGILHRDIKPSNIMLDRAGVVWITDFGLAWILDQQDLTHAGGIVGTLRYMAPEQLDGRSDARSDIFSLGLTLYELLTLTPVFSGEQSLALRQRIERQQISAPSGINSGIPRDLDTVLLKATATDPAVRYATAAALAEDLRRLYEDRPILARRLMPWERGWRWAKRNPALAGLTTAVFGLLVRFPQSFDYQLLAGRSQLRLGQLQMQEDPVRAIAALKNAIALLEPVADRFPNQGVVQIPLAQANEALALSLSSDADSSANYTEALAVMQGAVRRFENYLQLVAANNSGSETIMFNGRTMNSLCNSLARLYESRGENDLATQVRSKSADKHRR